MSGQPASSAVLQKERRLAVRHTCEVPTTCQPPSAWRKEPWPATIRDISTGGLSLSLARRFECGSGLAIELPTEDGGTNTVLARVIHVRPSPDGWLLGCRFISELGDEEMECVLRLDALRHTTAAGQDGMPPTRAGAAVNGVLFQAKVAPGEHLRWYVKHLDLSGTWPLPAGQLVSMRVGGVAGPPLELRIKNCRLFGSCWFIECKLKSTPSDEVLRALSSPPPDAICPSRR
jgi:hypothetical protein